MVGIPTDIIIHQHKTNDGRTGFTIFETKEENGKKYTKSTGHGQNGATTEWGEQIDWLNRGGDKEIIKK